MVELLLDFSYQAAVLRLERIKALAHDSESLRIELLERQILQLLPHLVHTHAAGQRSIDVERFLRTATARLRRHVGKRAHVVQSIGKLDQQAPCTSSAIASSSLRRFSACFASLVTRSSFLSLVSPSTSAPMSLPNIWSISARVAVRVLDRIMQKRGRDGRIVKLQVGKDRGHFERMGEIRIAGRPLLLPMGAHGVDIGPVEKRLACRGIVALHALDQIVLPHHLRLVGANLPVLSDAC